jgi:hypothetical protein
MAPLDDLIHSFLIAFKDSLYGAVPSVLNPTVHSKPKGHLLSVVAKEDSLDPSLNNYPCPYLFHVDLTITIRFFLNQRKNSKILVDKGKIHAKSKESRSAVGIN